MPVVPIGVVETPEFLAVAKRLMSENDRTLLVDYLANNPLAGDLIQGSGGLRKLRWGLPGRGKRGGARVIYFYYDLNLPLFLLTAYAKNAKADLNEDDRKSFRRLTEDIVACYGNRRKR